MISSSQDFQRTAGTQCEVSLEPAGSPSNSAANRGVGGPGERSAVHNELTTSIHYQGAIEGECLVIERENWSAATAICGPTQNNAAYRGTHIKRDRCAVVGNHSRVRR